MTSITTILALLPVLFSSGLGADLQKPLVLSVIGGLTIGTATAIYFVPLAYFYLSSKKQQKAAKLSNHHQKETIPSYGRRLVG